MAIVVKYYFLSKTKKKQDINTKKNSLLELKKCKKILGEWMKNIFQIINVIFTISMFVEIAGNHDTLNFFKAQKHVFMTHSIILFL